MTSNIAAISNVLMLMKEVAEYHSWSNLVRDLEALGHEAHCSSE